jgi:topoisomerase-4 subunit A
LEKIFIEKRIYRDIEECATWEGVMIAIWKGLKPYLKLLRREVTDDDVTRLTEIRIKRISKFNSFEADEYLRGLETQIAETKNHLENLTKYTIAYFRDLKSKYGKGRERKTEITSFARVAASEAAVATETLNVDWKEGFIGYGMKRTGEPLCKCSRLDDIIVFLEDGTMKVSKVSEKAFFGVPQHVAIFNKDKNLVYTMVYKDGRQGRIYVKRFQVGGVTRDTVYDLTKGTKGSKVLYFAVHDTEEESAAQSLTVHLNPAPRLKNTEIVINMSDVAAKGRAAIGITVTDHTVKRVSKTRAE